MKDRKYSVMDRTAAAAFAIVLGISGIWGLKEQENAPGENRAAMVREAADPAGMAADSAEESGAEQKAAGFPVNPRPWSWMKSRWKPCQTSWLRLKRETLRRLPP